MILGGVLKGARSRSSLRADGIPRAGLLLLYAYPTFDYWPDTAASPLRTCATELTVVDLHVSLRRHPVLRSIDLSCSGGTTALVGPNGSGKSILLRTIMGLTAATSGLIHVAGHTIPGELGKARDCSGHLPQRSSFPGRYTVREALDYATWTSPSRPLPQGHRRAGPGARSPADHAPHGGCRASGRQRRRHIGGEHGMER
ncbi:ATP-binding cassette domain-containing protein [Actinomyces israelii]|uniref:ATP-binding cassette domain-containing protein n=1 Tax=Actinomyces israelii TaxID=1659 RepID=UPI00338DCF05